MHPDEIATLGDVLIAALSFERTFFDLTPRAASRTGPLIAVTVGLAVAGGLEVALACNPTMTVGNTTRGPPEVERSLVAAPGRLMRLPRHRRNDNRRARLHGGDQRAARTLRRCKPGAAEKAAPTRCDASSFP
jgi:enoyl-CoA hydratase/carnithine racemase